VVYIKGIGIGQAAGRSGLRCRFDQFLTDGTVISEHSALCMTPPVDMGNNSVLSMKFDVSIDGGFSFFEIQPNYFSFVRNVEIAKVSPAFVVEENPFVVSFKSPLFATGSSSMPCRAVALVLSLGLCPSLALTLQLALLAILPLGSILSPFL